MPIYEYRCSACGETFEKLRRIQDADLPLDCPRCESDEIDRLLSAFATAGSTKGACTPSSRFT